MESRFIGLGRRRAETDSVLPFTDACVRSSAVRPQLQNRRNDPDVTDVYRKYVGGSQKHPTHTIVPEARYQIQMLAIRNFGNRPKTMTVSRQLRGKTWHLTARSNGDLPSSRQISSSRSGPNGLSLSLSLKRKRTVLLNEGKRGASRCEVQFFYKFLDTRREFGDRRWRWGAHDCRVYDKLDRKWKDSLVWRLEH